MSVIHNIIEQIHNLALQDDYRINHGGCGWFAVTAHNLLKEIDIDSDVIWGMYRQQDNNEMHTARSCPHAWLRIGTIRFDAEYVWGKNVYRHKGLFETVMPTELGNESVQDCSYGWNDEFCWNERELIEDRLRLIIINAA